MSESSKHTSAEPTDDGGPIREGWQITVADGHSGYGVYAHMDEYPEEGAVLIAAIPPHRADLLAALKDAMGALGGECFDWGPARAAIAKATGSTS